MSKELAKTYDPAGIEDRLYKKWEDNGYFHAEVDRSKKPFTIVMPPPNITGQLHMGHALDNTMQDILIRYKRMQGYNALWQPGTDHASIATEVKIIEKLKEEGIDKEDLGRRGIPGAGLGLEREVRRTHRQPAEEAGFFRRLGAESALPWTRAVPRPWRKCLSSSITRATFTRATASSTGARSARPPSPTQR